LSHKGHPNHDASFTSKALITSARVGGHDANPTNTISHSLEFALSSLATTSDEQYESIPDYKIALLARKFWAMHKFQKEWRRNFWGCIESGDTTHFTHFAILMGALLKLSHLVRTLIISNIKPFLRNLEIF
jgi:hypothetical protein